MPTPSAGQSPDAVSSITRQFSTCPDDPQQSPRHGGISIRPDPFLDELSTPALGVDSLQYMHMSSRRDTDLVDNNNNNNYRIPSSRNTTTSPGPPLISLEIPSSDHSSGLSPLLKGRETSPDALSPLHIAQVRYIEQHGQPRKTYSAPDMAVINVEDGACNRPSMGSDYPSLRVSVQTQMSTGALLTYLEAIPSATSSYLRPGSRFHGTQQSERQIYEVQVELKNVNMAESFLCGYLRIQGLTEDHPTLTTYFEGEIIGTKFSFFTKHEDWGANSKVDLSHWAKFSAFRPFQKHARRGPITIPDVTQNEHIFMRWKEHFLVPDHRVRTITGASFEGFYYICFNQLRGEVSGIYFHSKSEKFQQLELKHVPNRGCFSATEFR
ncbi:hypothetical protein E4U34_004329 [Claviceps purpurea]|nr:hypothetical protein E4U12_005571 [Claviceps purpurea]KAG6131106.1 hypothetical protein E4U38_004122 [Claviceps purpurea]KAG6147944.1 hypothetical protein E4U28_005590 [Claviceps purpurea]KAG6164644.1 hypothetical protein E4U51_004907 [Claviceps purpurea]KAG6172912.1 hypothetical protein E4U11_000004 [Claviceps purpurea]